MSAPLIISTRTREVWTYENKRHLDRLARMLNSAEVGLKLKCEASFCPDPTLRLIVDQTDPTGCVLQCGCKNRHFEPKPGRSRIAH